MKGRPSTEPVLTFRQTQEALEVTKKSKFLDAIQFPASIADISKIAKLWTIEYHPRTVMYRELQLPTPKALQISLINALYLGTKKNFESETQLINTLKKTVESLIYSNSAHALRDLWWCKR